MFLNHDLTGTNRRVSRSRCKTPGVATGIAIDDYDWVDDTFMSDLRRQVAGGLVLERSHLDKKRYTAAQALELMAEVQNGSRIELGGCISGDLVLDLDHSRSGISLPRIEGEVLVPPSSHIRSLHVGLPIEGSLTIDANLALLSMGKDGATQDLVVRREVEVGDVELRGSMRDLVVAGRVTRDLKVGEEASARDVILYGTVERVFGISGLVAGSLVVASEAMRSDDLRVWPLLDELLSGKACTGDLMVDCAIEGDVRVEGDVDGYVSFGGNVKGHLFLDGDVTGYVWISGQVSCSLGVRGRILGKLTVQASASIRYVTIENEVQDVEIWGRVEENLGVAGSVRFLELGDGPPLGSVDLYGKVEALSVLQRNLLEHLRIHEGCSVRSVDIGVESEVQKILISGDVENSLAVDGTVLSDLSVPGCVSTLAVHGKIHGSLTVAGAVRQKLEVGGTVDVLVALGQINLLEVAGEIRQELAIQLGSETNSITLGPASEIVGPLSIIGSIGALTLNGRVAEMVVASTAEVGQMMICGQIAGELTIDGASVSEVVVAGTVGRRTLFVGSPTKALVLSSIKGARFGEDVLVGDFVSIEDCDVRHCPDLHRLQLNGSFESLFPSGKGLRNEAMAQAPDELASANRSLRINLEGRGNRHASNGLYFGEMNARTRAAKLRVASAGSVRSASRNLSEFLILSIYRAMSGYGLVAWRPFAWFLLLGAGSAAVYATTDSIDSPCLFTLQSMVSFFNPPEANLTDAQEWLQFLLRFVGPVLIAQTILAIRERVAR